MAHFVKMTGNICSEVIVVNNEVLENKPFPESEPIGIAFLKSLYGENTEWLQTSYNGNFRGVYGGSGFIYNAETLAQEKTFDYFSDIEGWGLTHNDKHLIMSDGTNKIYFLNPENI